MAELADHDAKDLLVLVPEDSWLGTVKNASTPALGLGDTCVPAVSKGLWKGLLVKLSYLHGPTHILSPPPSPLGREHTVSTTCCCYLFHFKEIKESTDTAFLFQTVCLLLVQQM